jgi:hypothetical protein
MHLFIRRCKLCLSLCSTLIGSFAFFSLLSLAISSITQIVIIEASSYPPHAFLSMQKKIYEYFKSMFSILLLTSVPEYRSYRHLFVVIQKITQFKIAPSRTNIPKRNHKATHDIHILLKTAVYVAWYTKHRGLR